MSANYAQQTIDRLIQEGVAPSLAPYYALTVLNAGVLTSNADVHDAWAIWKTQHRPDHQFLIPYYQLSPEVQEKDTKFAELIRRVAREFV